MVCYLGMHMCTPKLNTKKYKSIVRETVLRNSGLGAHAIQQAEVWEAVATGDIQEAWRSALQLSCANLRYQKANLSHERNPDIYSLEAVCIFKRVTDVEDIFNL